MYRPQFPFGFVPVKTDSGEPPLGRGAGAGQASAGADVKLVGRNVPVTSGPPSGRDAVPSSDSFRARVVTSVPPPTSDRMIALCPPGPTSSMSTSSGKVCVSRNSTDFTTTGKVNPATAMTDG